MSPRARALWILVGCGLIVASLAIPSCLRARALQEKQVQTVAGAQAGQQAEAIHAQAEPLKQQVAAAADAIKKADAHAATANRGLERLRASLPAKVPVSSTPPESAGAPGAGKGVDAQGSPLQAEVEKLKEVVKAQEEQVQARDEEIYAQAQLIEDKDRELAARERQVKALQLALDASHRSSSGTWGGGVLYRPQQLGQPQSYGAFVEKEFGQVVVIATGTRDGGTVGVGFKFGSH